MICQRCGWCCNHTFNFVIKPEYIDIITGEEDFQEGMLQTVSEEHGPCPHLSFDNNGQACCAVHDKPWYKDTPCFQYQSHLPDKPCMMGVHLMRKRTSMVTKKIDLDSVHKE